MSHVPVDPISYGVSYQLTADDGTVVVRGLNFCLRGLKNGQVVRVNPMATECAGELVRVEPPGPSAPPAQP